MLIAWLMLVNGLIGIWADVPANEIVLGQGGVFLIGVTIHVVKEFRALRRAMRGEY